MVSRRILLLGGVLLAALPLAGAEVVRVDIAERGIIAGGKSFGEVGPYEKIEGTLHFEFDPDNEANAAIVDLSLAPRNARGQVEARADLFVLQPVDPDRGSGTALLEVSNRGGKASLRYYNAASTGDLSEEESLGDGFLMRRGLTVIWVGWQFDVPEDPARLRLHLPVLSGVQGWVRSDWTVDEERESLELGHRGHVPYGVVDPGGDAHVLTERDGRLAPRRVVPREAWRFIDDGKAIQRDGGFPAGRIYELVYRATDPVVVGLGLAAIRDTMAFARYDKVCPFAVQRGFALGISQTGRFLRQFLYQGFNTDERRRKVFEGLFIHTAGAGRGSFNHRFGQPSRDAHRYSAFFYPTDLFPFSGRAQRDPLSERREGLLDRVRASGHAPKIFYSNTGYEYWGRAASLLHTSLDGSADVTPLPDVRIYHQASCQHFPIPFPTHRMVPLAGADGYRGNPIDFLVIGRALVAAMQEWIEDGVDPPPSAYPRIDNGTMVPIEQAGFPAIPGVAFPEVIHEAFRADYGLRFADGIVDRQPPVLGPAFPSLVSRVDADGNELAGIRPIEIQVPLATYTPWHVRTGMPGGNGELTDFWGTVLPFPRDAAEREERGDPRASIAGRYASREAYLARVEKAARSAVRQRHLLEEDLPRVLSRAGELWDWVASR
jgi:hypothetical protein